MQETKAGLHIDIILIQYSLSWATTPVAREKWSLMIGGRLPERLCIIFEVCAKVKLNIDHFRMSDIM